MNEKLKRVGRVAPYTRGGRIATRNLDLIPPADHPASRALDAGTFRYYDISRNSAVVVNGVSSGLDANPNLKNLPVQGQWRSMARDRISVVTAYWDLNEEVWKPL